MYVLVGTCWIVGTVYLDTDPEGDSGGSTPLPKLMLDDFIARTAELIEAVRGGVKGRKGRALEG